MADVMRRPAVGQKFVTGFFGGRGQRGSLWSKAGRQIRARIGCHMDGFCARMIRQNAPRIESPVPINGSQVGHRGQFGAVATQRQVLNLVQPDAMFGGDDAATMRPQFEQPHHRQRVGVSGQNLVQIALTQMAKDKGRAVAHQKRHCIEQKGRDRQGQVKADDRRLAQKLVAAFLAQRL